METSTEIMVVPKTGGCCGGTAKAAPKKTTKPSAAKKPTTTNKPTQRLSTGSKSSVVSSSTTPTRKNDDALKKRLKNILEKANVTTSTSKTSTGNSDPSENKNIQDLLLTSDVQKFILNVAKKEANATTAKAPKKVSSVQPKKVSQSNTKTTKTGAASSGTAKKLSTTSCAGGACSLVKKVQATSTIQKANCKSTVKKTAAGGRSTAVTTKKVTTNKRTSCCNPNGGECSFDCSSSSCDCGCGYSTETDDSDDDEDSSEEYSESSSFDDSDSDDSDDGGCCNGRSCGKMNGRGKRDNQRKRSQSSGSWDTLSDSDGGKRHSKKCKFDWQCENLNSPINTNIQRNEHSWVCEELKAPLQIIENKPNHDMRSDRANKNSLKANDKRNKQTEPTLSNKVDKADVNDDLPRKLNGQKNRLKTNPTEMQSKTDVDKQTKPRKGKKAEFVSSKDSKPDKKKKLKSDDNDLHTNSLGQNKHHQMSLVPYQDNNGNESDSDRSSEYNYIVDIRGEDISTSSSDYTYDEEENEDEESDFEYDSDEETSEEFDSEDDEYSDEEESETESSSNYEYASEENSVDGDYQLPEGVEEDILIRRGEANIYDATDDVGFDSDDSSPQIFELPNDNIESTPNQKDVNNISPEHKSINHTIVSGDRNIQEESDSNDSCPQLVPIDFSNELAEHQDYMMEYSSVDDDGSDSSVLSGDPPAVEPEIIETDYANLNISQGSSFFDNNFLETIFNFETETGSTDLHNNPLDLFMQTDCDTSNYKVISVSNKKFDRHSENSRRKTNDTRTSTSSSNMLSSPAIQHDSRRKNKPSPSIDPFAQFDEIEMTEVEPSQSRFYNSLNSYQVLLLLKSPISFHGTLKVKLVAGNIDILGYKAKVGETLEVFSPRGNNLQSLTPLPSTVTNETKLELEKQITAFKADFLQTDLHEILQEYDSRTDAIVLLDRNSHSKRVHMVKKYMKEDIFPGTNVSKNSPFYQSEFILQCRFHLPRTFNNIYISPQWNSVSLKNTSKLLIIGGKGVGKSTFLRYTINNNFHQFKQFVLIDLDIGQPEVFVPQTISVTLVEKPILGPGHYYGLVPDKCYLHGDINVVLSPQTYLSNVKELLKYCHHENRFKNVPWVINTMGYNKGFGPELLSIIIEHLQPTDVVQLHSLKQFDNFEFPMSADAVRTIPRNIYIDEEPKDIANYKLYIFESVAPIRKADRFGDWQMSAMEVRLTMVVSMLGSLLSEREEWLTDVRPYRVSADDLNIIYLGQEKLTKEELMDVINVNIVYLCNDSTPAIECYGIGLVRGVDKYQQAIYLLPSIPPQTLVKVNTIAVCNNPLPASFLLNQGPKVKGPVPYTYNTNDLIATKHVPQKVYRPQHYLQGSRNVVLNE